VVANIARAMFTISFGCNNEKFMQIG